MEEDSQQKFLLDVVTFANRCSDIPREEMERLLEEFVANSSGENSQSQTKPSKDGRIHKSWWKKSRCMKLLLACLVVPLLLVAPVFHSKSYQQFLDHSPAIKSIIGSSTHSYIRQNIHYLLFYKPLRHISLFFDLPWESDEVLKPEEDCLLPNPFKASRAPDDTCHCKGIQTIMTFRNLSRSIGPMGRPLHQPLVLRGLGSKVSRSDLEDQLTRYAIYLRKSRYFTSNHPGVKTMEDLSNPETFRRVMDDPTTHIIWAAGHVMRTSIIRRLFSTEHLPQVYYDTRVLLLDGRDSVSYTLPEEFLDEHKYLIYLQGWGARRILLTPSQQCRMDCVTLVTNLNEGDILMYNAGTWTLRSETLRNSSSLASVSIDYV